MATLRTPSIFNAPASASPAQAEAVKGNLGLFPITGDEGTVGLDSVDREARIRQRRFARIVMCTENGKVAPDEKRLRTPSLFTCPNNDALCQRTLFLNEGLIAIGNDPTARDVAGFDNLNTNRLQG